MFLLITVINNEEILEELITGWLDIGVTGATVSETTDFLQLISYHIPIFAGFRSLTSGGMRHNKTLFTAIADQTVLEEAVAFLEELCRQKNKPHQGVYFVAPLLQFGYLGAPLDPDQRQKDIEKKIGK